METTLLIILVVYSASALTTREVLHKMYSADGIWYDKIEYRLYTALRSLCPIYNIIFPVYWLIKGINKK